MRRKHEYTQLGKGKRGKNVGSFVVGWVPSPLLFTANCKSTVDDVTLSDWGIAISEGTGNCGTSVVVQSEV
jgi:hypothetical protein